MDAMGQRLLYPPNVSGWRPNGYWVNASAMEGRARTAQSFNWAATRTYWKPATTGLITLRYGDLTNAQVTARTARRSDVVERRLHRPARGLHGHSPHDDVEGGDRPLRRTAPRSGNATTHCC